jgi:hypothetical protein
MLVGTCALPCQESWTGCRDRWLGAKLAHARVTCRRGCCCATGLELCCILAGLGITMLISWLRQRSTDDKACDDADMETAPVDFGVRSA